MFRTWLISLVIPLIAVAMVPTICHSAGMDQGCQDCTVCELVNENESFANLASGLHVPPTNTPEALARAPGDTLVFAFHGSQIPTRAPPLSVFPSL